MLSLEEKFLLKKASSFEKETTVEDIKASKKKKHV